MAPGKTLLILGGGIGDIIAASRLRSALSREHRIVLVEQASTHLFQPSLLWLMLGLRAPHPFRKRRECRFRPAGLCTAASRAGGGTCGGAGGDSGWVAVDRAMLATPFPGVYAIGDVTGIPHAIGKPLPKAGVLAHGQAEVVAHNLVAEITGGRHDDAVPGRGRVLHRSRRRPGWFRQRQLLRRARTTHEAETSRAPAAWGKVAYEKYWLYKWF
ncbi:MAG: hypothetical protein Q8M05_07645 [Rhodoferax sp.]|uniref:hypothetical protein n=1 Tax=Rhodoferax sp. TaxID=50421 RepID=UPI002731AFEB|nr:hypothetical protein [Rhodoferax sp.]MDP1529239.1 hypothetical protein [Rhodoferax sp.]